MSRMDPDKVYELIGHVANRLDIAILGTTGNKRNDMALHYFAGARALAYAMGRGELADALTYEIEHIRAKGYAHVLGLRRPR